jgi:uncharacterized membrane protein YqjE
MPALRTDRGEPSVGELFGQLSQDMSLLFRQEMQLAKAELSDKISRATSRLASLVAGALIAWLGALALVAGIILVLDQPVGLASWLAALLVGIVLAGVGAFLLRGALRDLKQLDLVPRRTVETLKDDVRWAKEQRP